MKQKEKLAKRLNELNTKVSHLESETNPEGDNITPKSDVDFLYVMKL